ncbi:MAG: hypothetical protein LBR31_04010 [Desulfovibrio sp.]|nr:hypothetical protein [Desulfovibrio sp.]
MSKIIYIRGGTVVEELALEEGQTYNDAKRLLCKEREDFPLPTICMVESQNISGLVMREDWDDAIDVEFTVMFVDAPQGGGGGGGGSGAGGIMKIVGMVLVVAATIATWWAGGAGGAVLGLSMTAWKAIGVAGAVMMFAGSLIEAAMVQTPKVPSMQTAALGAESASPTYNTIVPATRREWGNASLKVSVA